MECHPARARVGAVELPVGLCDEGPHGLERHEEAREEVDPRDGPQPREDEYQEDGEPRPGHRHVEVLGQPPADAEDDASARTIDPLRVPLHLQPLSRSVFSLSALFPSALFPAASLPPDFRSRSRSSVSSASIRFSIRTRPP